MAGSQVQCEVSVTPEPGVQSRVPAGIELRRSSQPPVLEDLDRRAKELLRTIANAQIVLIKANCEFFGLFRQIYSQLPPRKPTRDKKKASVVQDIYEWSEEAAEQTGAQIHWKGLIKQLKAQTEKKGNLPDE
jgi:hypothetical protein